MKDEIKEKMTIGKAKKILRGFLAKDCYYDTPLYYAIPYLLDYITNLQEENKELNRMCELYSKSLYNAELTDYKSRIDKAIENAKEKIKRYESYINDLKNGNYPSPTVKQEIQELIFRIREQEELLNILNGSDKDE